MGSKYFFEDMEGFTSHDTDLWEILDTDEFEVVRSIRGKGKDYFQFRKQNNAEDYIEKTTNLDLPMTVGKFLIPEFCEEIGLSFDQFKTNKRIKLLIDQLDDKHIYEKIIYESYLENNSFTLTEEQRKKAYDKYLKVRK